MTRKITASKMSVVGSRARPTLPERQIGPAKLDHNNPVPIEEFDREHMGIAAKE